MNVALVNTNRIKPPIAPIGLDYVAEAVHAAGHQVEVCDLCWATDPGSELARFLEEKRFGLVGITLRNTDDCAFTSRHSFLPDFLDLMNTTRAHYDGPVVVGGVGFSVMPELVLSLCGADAGLWGSGEFVLPQLVDRVQAGEEWRDLPNLFWRDGEAWRRNPPSFPPLKDLPPMTRRWVDNRRYHREGGQAGFETKRGCAGCCIYCADPLAKGRHTRTRPIEAVVTELKSLVGQEIDHLHTCDSEFNLPPWHAAGVCQGIIDAGLADKLRWYAYCSPAPFSKELAEQMHAAGCVGINFGVDHGDASMLQRLGRAFTPDDILNATAWCKAAGMAVMLDLLLGSPGETRDSIARTIDLVKCADPDRVGVALGVRVYPGTELEKRLSSGGTGRGLVGGTDPMEPLFFLEPELGDDVFEWLDDTIGGDQRFLFFDPSRPDRNYNYNANQRLVEAIAQGYRGAYWDILRRYE